MFIKCVRISALLTVLAGFSLKASWQQQYASDPHAVYREHQGSYPKPSQLPNLHTQRPQSHAGQTPYAPQGHPQSFMVQPGGLHHPAVQQWQPQTMPPALVCVVVTSDVDLSPLWRELGCALQIRSNDCVVHIARQADTWQYGQINSKNPNSSITCSIENASGLYAFETQQFPTDPQWTTVLWYGIKATRDGRISLVQVTPEIQPTANVNTWMNQQQPAGQQ